MASSPAGASKGKAGSALSVTDRGAAGNGANPATDAGRGGGNGADPSYVPAHAAPRRRGRLLAVIVVLALVAGGVVAFLARRGSGDTEEKALRTHIPAGFLETCTSQSPSNVPGATVRLTCVYQNNTLDYYRFPRLGALATYFDSYKAKKNVKPGTCPAESPTAKFDETWHQEVKADGKTSEVTGELLCVHGLTNAHLAWSQPDQLIFATAYGNTHDMTGHCAQSEAFHSDDFGPRVDPDVRVKRLASANQDPADMCAKDMKGAKDDAKDDMKDTSTTATTGGTSTTGM